MDYFLLETFIVASETLNLSQTAAILYKTQPTITNRIKLLEKYLGFSLFIRQKGKRNIILTGKGKDFLPIARELMKLYDDVDDVQSNLQKSLTISSIDSIGTTIVPEVCKYLRRDKDLSLTIKTYQTPESYRAVAEREVDIAFVSEKIEMKNVVCEAAFQQDYFVVKPCSEPGAVKNIHPRDLDIEEEVFQSWGEGFWAWHTKWWGDAKVPPVRVDSNALLVPFLTDRNKWSVIQAGNVEPLRRNMPV